MKTDRQRKAMFANLNKRMHKLGLTIQKTKKTDIAPDSAIIRDPAWQEFRKSLKGIPTTEKLNQLSGWLKKQKHSTQSNVQVSNYLNALKRGGQLK